MIEPEPVLDICMLDACVIFPASVRDALLRAADGGFYELRITEEILEEVRRNLVNKGHMPDAKAQNLIDAISGHFSKAFVTGYQSLIPSMPVNEKDRHVLAAAVASYAQVIVTENLKDFPPHLLDPLKVKALSPDEFLIRLFRLQGEQMIQLITQQAAELRKSPKTVAELLDTLALHTPKFVSLIRPEFTKVQPVEQSPNQALIDESTDKMPSPPSNSSPIQTKP